MKKHLVLSVLLAFCFVSWAFDFSAVAPTGQTLYYNISSSSTLTVELTLPGNNRWDGYTKPAGTLTIPSTVIYGGNTYAVTSIGDYAFLNCSGLTSMTIPNSVTSIGDYGVMNCSGLTSLTIPNSVTSIGNSAFTFCSGLTSVTIPSSVTSIGSAAFRECSGLTSITIPNSVTTIESSVFDGCSGLTSVTIPNSVTSIGNYAFRDCSGLTSVTIPNSVALIKDRAFYNCSDLLIVYTLNPTAPTLWSDCFSGCPIQEIHVPCGCMESYSYEWYEYSDYLQEQTVTFERELQSANDTMGGVSLLTLECADTSTILATPNYGYHFTHWSDGDTTNPRTFVLTQDTSFTAQFGYNSYAIVKSFNAIQGNVMGVDSADYLSNVVLTAEPNYGYHFTQWSDGVTVNPRTFVLTQDTSFTAEFASNQYAILGTSISDAMGTVSGSDTVDYMQTVILTATANYGYRFTQWNDGNIDNPRIIVADSNKSFTAQFGYNAYAVTKSCDTIQGNVVGVDSADYLSNIVLTAEPNYGYHFTQWSDGVTDNPRTFVLTQDTVFVAEFERNSYIVTCVSNDVSMGQVQGGGTFLYLDTIVLTAEAVEPYTFSHWQDGDTVNPRSVVVYSDSTFTAYFENSTEGIETVQKKYTLAVVGNAIRISGAMGETVSVFDVVGRQLLKKKLDSEEIRLNLTGVFFVQVGNAPAEKVVLVR